MNDRWPSIKPVDGAYQFEGMPLDEVIHGHKSQAGHVGCAEDVTTPAKEVHVSA